MKTGRGSAKKDKTEALKPTAENKKVGKRKAALRADKNRKKLTKREKSVNKDLKNPKRPLSAFFIFLEEFRKVFKQEHPNVKAVSAVGKAGGEKWKSMTAEEKAPFEAKAAKRKAEYQQLMTAYNRKQENTDDDDEDDESDHSKSEFSNDEETVEEEEDYDDDD